MRCFLLFLTLLVSENSWGEVVSIRPNSNIKFFRLPTSEEPVMTWMDIQRGIFPNTTRITSNLEIGEPITIFIYMKDTSSLYDLMVSDCWAYDNEDFAKATNKLRLSQEDPVRKFKVIKKWFKADTKNVLYTDLTSFKFPEKDQVYIKCDIQV